MTSQAHSRAADIGAAYELTAELDATGQGLRPAPARTGRYATGSVIAGKYQLGQFLGEGGMGSVWVARNRTLDLEVAVKLMRPELAGDVDGIAERMLQEARAAASIGHPSIIQVFDFGLAEQGDPFIVMELLRGESLAQAIRRRGRVNPVRAAQTLLPIVDALSAAHRLGIVHRDLKPENIFLARPAGQRLQPKVLDFGIAKLEQRAQERLTRDGAVIGSPAYMAPEQLRGEPHVDARADVWSLGVVFYEMITGHRPFEGATYHASMWNIVNAEPRPLAEHDVVDVELARILQQSFMKDPQQRCPDMRSFGRALAGWLLRQGVHEDVCNASLASWVDDATSSGAAAHSFFPSDIPGVDPPRQEVEADPSGTRRIDARGVPEAARAESSARRVSHHAVLVGGAALVAFVGAALFASVDRDDGEAELAAAAPPPPAPQRAREPSLVLAPDGARGVLSPIASALTDDAAQPAETRVHAERGTVRRTGTSGKPLGRVYKKRSELKDPFD